MVHKTARERRPDGTQNAAVAEKSHLVRLPTHAYEQVVALRRAREDLRTRLEREPTMVELANRVGVSPEREYRQARRRP